MGNNYSGILGFAMNVINQNPEVRNNPQYAEMIRAIESNDPVLGQQLANNILKNYGVTKGQAIQRAQQLFNLPG